MNTEYIVSQAYKRNQDGEPPLHYHIVVLLAHSYYMYFKNMGRRTEFNRNADTILLEIIYEKMGIDFSEEDFELTLIEDDLSLIPVYDFVNSYTHQNLRHRIESRFGVDAMNLYLLTSHLFTIYGLCSMAEILIESKQTGKIDFDTSNFEEMLVKCLSASIFIFSVKKEVEFLNFYFVDDFVRRLKKMGSFLKSIKEVRLDTFKEISEEITTLMVSILPTYNKSQFKLEKGLELISKLSRVKSGVKEWREYEKLCMEILNYLFTPPFKNIYFQARTEDGYERRDAVIPNNSDTFFWNQIKDEFSCKNIVCEFKNGMKASDKDALNQLRIYLSKPTIGRFGLLFIRTKDKIKNLLQARRDAYSQSNIMIIIIDDALLEKMVYSRAYFGNCDDVLEGEKVRFEITY